MPDTVNHFAHQLSALATIGDQDIDKARLTPRQLHHLQLCIDTMHSTASFLLEPQDAERLYHSVDSDPPLEHTQAAGLTLYMNKQPLEATA